MIWLNLDMNSKSENALNFVNLLVPGSFDEAREWLAPNCSYNYSGKSLLGNEIIASFEDNHNKAKETFDGVEYLSGQIIKQESDTTTIEVKDKVSHKDQVHIYTDQLLVECNEKIGHGSIIKITHNPILEEKNKFKTFLEEVDTKWS